MAHHGVIKADKHIITTQKNFTAVPSSRHSMFATAASENGGSQKITRKSKNKTKQTQQNNVKTFIVASQWISTHLYMN